MKCAFLFVTHCFATWCSEQINSTGKVPGENNEPISFASILLVGSEKGSITNDKSDYSFTIRSGMVYSNEIKQLGRAFGSKHFRNWGSAEHHVFFRKMGTDLLQYYTNRFNNFKIDFSLEGNSIGLKARDPKTQNTGPAQHGIFRLSNAASPIEVIKFKQKNGLND